MKKILIISMCLFTCNNIHQLKAQEKITDSKVSWDDVKKSTGDLRNKVNETKKIINNKHFKTITIHDTVWVEPDTLYVYNLTYEDSARIVAHFRGTDVPKVKKPTGVGKVLKSVFGNKKNKSND